MSLSLFVVSFGLDVGFGGGIMVFIERGVVGLVVGREREREENY